MGTATARVVANLQTLVCFVNTARLILGLPWAKDGRYEGDSP